MTDHVGGLVLLAIAGVLWLRDRLQSEPDPIERVHERYAAGELSEDELERELEVLLDERTNRLRKRLEDVANVGPVTADRVAREFRSVERLRRAEREDLTAIHGVGESTAQAILREFGA